jgi:hypothetical protein
VGYREHGNGLSDSQKPGDFLTSRVTISFSKRTLLHVVTSLVNYVAMKMKTSVRLNTSSLRSKRRHVDARFLITVLKVKLIAHPFRILFAPMYIEDQSETALCSKYIIPYAAFLLLIKSARTSFYLQQIFVSLHNIYHSFM